jgi:hypothetical protein
MNRDDIHDRWLRVTNNAPVTIEMVSEFAALVAAAEREACAAIILERGVDLSGLARDSMTQAFTEKLLMVCAHAIRARGEQ